MNGALKVNNFDLIRLLAAAQVIFGHTCTHLHLNGYTSIHFLWKVAGLFPGVEIFFMISGFLISAAFERTPTLQPFFINRILRIYPALWTSFLVGLLLISASGYWTQHGLHFSEFIKWSLGQLTIVQFYNPPFLRDFGLGVLNGSLWSITVELQFYLLVPILYVYFNKMSAKAGNYFLLALIILFASVNFFTGFLYEGNFYNKLLNVTFLPHFYMFLLGIFYQRNSKVLLIMTENKFPIYLIGYLLIAVCFGNHIHINDAPKYLMLLALSLVIFSFAFSFKQLSHKILRKVDISYGLYIYHMLVINMLIQCHYLTDSLIDLLTVCALTICLSLLSFFYIERPAFKFKQHRRDASELIFKGAT